MINVKSKDYEYLYNKYKSKYASLSNKMRGGGLSDEIIIKMLSEDAYTFDNLIKMLNINKRGFYEVEFEYNSEHEKLRTNKLKAYELDLKEFNNIKTTSQTLYIETINDGVKVLNDARIKVNEYKTPSYYESLRKFIRGVASPKADPELEPLEYKVKKLKQII